MRTFTAHLGGTEVQIWAPQGASQGSSLDNLHEMVKATLPRGELFGLDVESTYLGPQAQFAPDFRVRLVQLATTGYAWVLRPGDKQHEFALREVLNDPDRQWCSHTNMDVLALYRGMPPGAGVDIVDRNLDTRMLASLWNGDKTFPRDLKSLTTLLIGPELEEAEEALHARFRELWVAAGGKRNAAKAKVEEFGWNNISIDDELYLTYAGLDAVACRRLAPLLIELADQPPRIVDLDRWLAAKANRIQIRGMVLDVEAARKRNHEAEDMMAAADDVVRNYTGLSAGQDQKLGEWFLEHDTRGVIPDDFPRTDTGRLSLTKDSLPLLPGPVAKAAARYKSYVDAQRKTADLLARADAQGRVHPVLNVVGTVTHRMSSSQPNFQNFEVSTRGLLEAEDGFVLLTADFEQVELRVVAALAREQKMIDVILEGGDLHQLTVDELAEMGITIIRPTGKMANFLIVYGGGGKALSEQSHIPLNHAYEIVDGHRKRYKKIAELTERMGTATDSIRTASQRRIIVTKNKIGDARTYANINSLVQSTSRDVLAHAWWNYEQVEKRHDEVWFPVHDEMVLQVPADQVGEAKQAIERSMSFDFMGVPISATAVVLGKNWGKG